MNTISLEQLKAKVPSIFTEHAGPRTNAATYRFVNTEAVLAKAMDAGFVVREARAKGTRSADGQAYAKHELKLVHQSMLNTTNEYVPELIIINGHNCNSSIQLHLGVFRFICSNGLVAASSAFESMRIVHSQRYSERIEAGIQNTLDAMPKINALISAMQSRELNTEEARDFAFHALTLRNLENPLEYSPSRLLRARRVEDQSNSLWCVFNRVQENVMQGGAGMRRLTAMDSQLKLNRALWAEAEAYL